MGFPSSTAGTCPAVAWSIEVADATDPTTGPVRTVRVAGELDLATSPELMRIVERAAGTTTHLVLDLRAVTFFDVVGAGALERAEPWLAARGCRLTLLGTESAFGALLPFGGLFPRLLASSRPLDLRP